MLVNNAAVNRRMPILEMDAESWDWITRIDLRLPYFLSRAAARRMIEQGPGGSIVSISSLNALYALEQISVYGPAKAGLSQLTKVMALEWAEHGIRANAIAPGFMDTPLAAPIWADDDMRRWILNRVPVERPGLPRELVGACLLLASDAGSFLNGPDALRRRRGERRRTLVPPRPVGAVGSHSRFEQEGAMKIAVVGAGAMGSIFGARFAQAGHDTVLVDVAQPLVEAINADGVTVVRGDEETTTQVPATTDPASVGPVDLVVFFVKCYHTQSAAELARPLVGPDTVVASLQNGWGNGDVLAAVYPPEQVVVGVTYNSGLLEAPGPRRPPRRAADAGRVVRRRRTGGRPSGSRRR